MKIIENVTSNEVKKSVFERFFERNPSFYSPKFEAAYSTLLPETTLKRWDLDGGQFALMFLSQPGLARLDIDENFFRKGSPSRFVKSLFFDWDTGAIVSLGLPMMGSVNDKSPFFEFLKNSSKVEYREKLDGVCLLATQHNDNLLVKSRRSVYHYGPSIQGMLCVDKLDVGAKIQDLIHGEWANLGPFTAAFECVFPHPYFYKCGNPQFAALLGSSPHFTPYVAYHKEGVFLTSMLKHSGEFVSQTELDRLANKYSLPVAATVAFDSVESAKLHLKSKSNHEGFITHIDEGQTPLKWKTSWYRQVFRVSSAYHRAKRSAPEAQINELQGRSVVTSNIEGL